MSKTENENRSSIKYIRLKPSTAEAIERLAVEDDRTFSAFVSKVLDGVARKLGT